MREGTITFFSDDVIYNIRGKRSIDSWLKMVGRNEKSNLGSIQVVFCSDKKILQINKKYLGHNYYTDVITFDYSEDNIISGEIYVSIDRVRENAKIYKVYLRDELCRVILHGLLHLIGYKDQSLTQKRVMKGKEDHYLALRS